MTARDLNHVGVNVPDLDAALAWYQDVLGFTMLTPPAVMDVEDPQLGPALRAMMGDRVKRFKIAHLTAGNGVGLQFFEFLEPRYEAPAEPDAFWRATFFHICVTDSDIGGLAARIAARGGRASEVFRAITGTPYAAAYCADPWGNVIEINSHEYPETRTFLKEA
jgi:catechol 2,3-dioxygenase-like lactoylglutathione lyase family enzyme